MGFLNRRLYIPGSDERGAFRRILVTQPEKIDFRHERLSNLIPTDGGGVVANVLRQIDRQFGRDRFIPPVPNPFVVVDTSEITDPR
jgi:hypothetical protein